MEWWEETKFISHLRYKIVYIYLTCIGKLYLRDITKALDPFERPSAWVFGGCLYFPMDDYTHNLK